MQLLRTFPFLVFFLVLGTFSIPSPIAALDTGCHAPSEQEKAEQQARGLPVGSQVCPADAKILGIGKDFEAWYAQLKTQSPCNKNSCALSCKTRNTGAQVCGPTATRWNAIGCHPNNRTAIFPTVSHGFAAHIELLRRYCGERHRCTIGSVIQQWTATTGDRPAYTNFVSKNAGMPYNQVFDPNDIDLMGRIALAMSCFKSGSMPYNAAELKQGLIMAGGGARVAVPGNVGELLNESLSGSYVGNPDMSPNSHPGSWGYPASTLSGSQYKPPTTGSSNPLPIINPSDVNPAGNGTTGVGTTAPAAAVIIAQPATVKPGGFVLVSWTTINGGNNCTVKQGTEIGRGASGTERARVPQGYPAGILTYELSCQGASGSEPLTREAEVTVVP